MQKRLSIIKTAILVVILVLLGIIINQNWYTPLRIFSIQVNVLLASVGFFIAGWFSSKALGGNFTMTKLREQIADMEEKLDKVLTKGLEEGQKVADKAKGAIAADLEDEQTPNPKKATPRTRRSTTTKSTK